MRGGNRTYDHETKLAAVRVHVDEGLPAPEVARRYGLSTVELLGKWCRAYREGGAEALRPRPRDIPRAHATRRNR